MLEKNGSRIYIWSLKQTLSVPVQYNRKFGPVQHIKKLFKTAVGLVGFDVNK